MRYLIILALFVTSMVYAINAHEQAIKHHWRYKQEQLKHLNKTERQVEKSNLRRKFGQQSDKTRAAEPILRRELREQRPKSP